jgi:hypothetical protein
MLTLLKMIMFFASQLLGMVKLYIKDYDVALEKCVVLGQHALYQSAIGNEYNLR